MNASLFIHFSCSPFCASTLQCSFPLLKWREKWLCYVVGWLIWSVVVVSNFCVDIRMWKKKIKNRQSCTCTTYIVKVRLVDTDTNFRPFPVSSFLTISKHTCIHNTHLMASRERIFRERESERGKVHTNEVDRILSYNRRTLQ